MSFGLIGPPQGSGNLRRGRNLSTFTEGTMPYTSWQALLSSIMFVQWSCAVGDHQLGGAAFTTKRHSSHDECIRLKVVPAAAGQSPCITQGEANMLKTASALLLECVKPVHGTCSPPQLAALLVGTWARRPSLFCYCYNCTRFQTTFHLLGVVAWRLGGRFVQLARFFGDGGGLTASEGLPHPPSPPKGRGQVKQNAVLYPYFTT